MKRLIALALLATAMLSHAAGQSRPITLGWNDPNYPASTNGFLLRYTTSLSVPTNQWVVLAYIQNPVPVATNYFQFTTPTNMPPTNYFFVGSFTNSYWHLESFFSNGAATPSLPASQVVDLQVLLP